jgi:hypothetical protein
MRFANGQKDIKNLSFLAHKPAVILPTRYKPGVPGLWHLKPQRQGPELETKKQHPDFSILTP